MKNRRKHYNYLGENMYDLYGGDSYWEACQKQHTGLIETPIRIVYDGKAPYDAAKNLYAHIVGMGYDAVIVDSDDYQKGHDGSVIVVGHHSLSKEWIDYVGVDYNTHGMRYGFSGNLCVLTASRSALGRGKKGRKLFEEYYNSKIVNYFDQAVKYKIPMTFGYRSETRKSQYDLLLLEFLTKGLLKFLNGEEESSSKGKNDFIEDIVNNLAEKMEADKDMIFNLGDILHNCYKQNIVYGSKTLCTHLGEQIVFTGVYMYEQEGDEIKGSELLEGEISASIFEIGDYLIRCAQRLYQDNDRIRYTERIPATRDMINEYMINNSVIDFIRGRSVGLRKCYEISVRYIGEKENASSDEWKYICLATDSASWSESIDFMATVKKNNFESNKTAHLFVQKRFIGSSYTVDYWYQLTPDGNMTEYIEHPYSSEPFKILWDE